MGGGDANSGTDDLGNIRGVDGWHYLASYLPLERAMSEFQECDTCKAKPGSPALCYGCLSNRGLISSLTARVVALEASGDEPARKPFRVFLKPTKPKGASDE